MTTSVKSRKYSKLDGLLHGKNLDDKDRPQGRSTYLLKASPRAAVFALVTVFVIIACFPLLSPNKKASLATRKAYSTASFPKCDLFSGDWVPNPDGPAYNSSCYGIHEHQNCMKFGRPNLDFLKWRWKPDDCELSIFDADEFLDTVRDKSVAIVGDSVGRNHLQSLICLLSKIQYPEHIYASKDDRIQKWKYFKYNFTIAKYWTPFLVNWKESDPDGPSRTGVYDLFLDEFDATWAAKLDDYDYVIINSGRWFYRSSIYYENGSISGCRYCLKQNVPDLPMRYGYRMAFKTAFRAINGRENYRAVTFLRTLAPSHFENGKWNEGGNCLRTTPYSRNETSLVSDERELYDIQLEEFEMAKKEGKKKGRKYVLFDTTKAMMLRPDGHPSKYGHSPDEEVVLKNDCVHWCLPGAIDVWNDLFFEMLKRRVWEN